MERAHDAPSGGWCLNTAHTHHSRKHPTLRAARSGSVAPPLFLTIAPLCPLALRVWFTVLVSIAWIGRGY
ncbi:hypothetical protein MUK42_36559 [Musa troglodytarum]|uniref:Uncharacterized protein n=1 Tax=Musa troglodytarum TaxID=320322 RepID=A0A9E7GB78_9LILI|nr:hypothetical protein MUK42_36559 [Musa troglodytarum]